MMNILLLEDDHILSETLTVFLEHEGFEVDSAVTIDEAIEKTFVNRYDLYLFDINLSDGSGLRLLRDLRKADDDTPTIFITALDDLKIMAESFELSAMDYIKKPFDPQELLIRLKAKFKNDMLRYGDIEYHPKETFVRKHGKAIDLGNVPLCVFVKLLENVNTVVSKETLLACLDKPSDSALRVAITKIKQRLGIDIKNIRSKGYMLEAL